MPSVKLTAAKLNFLKPESKKQVDYFDKSLPGFFVRVSQAGRKSFGVMYRHSGRMRRMTIGTHPPLTLADARRDATAVLRDAAHGIDPAADKKEKRLADTFEKFAAEYLERYAKVHKKSWENDDWIIRKYLQPSFGTIHAKEITRRDVRALLEKIAANAPIMANRVKAQLNKMFNWGIANDAIEVNPVEHIPMPGKEHKRERVLTEDEIKKVWAAMDAVCETDMGKRKYALLTAFSLKLRLLTAQRGGEVEGMAWSEIDGEWWTIPGERTKNGLSHRVPLTPQSLRVIEEAKKLCEQSPSDFVFPGPRGGHIDNVQKAIGRIGKRAQVGDFTAHDLRRTAASLMTGMGILRLVVSKILNHVEPGVTAIYDRHSYDKEKKEALELWGKRIMVIISNLREVQKGAIG